MDHIDVVRQIALMFEGFAAPLVVAIVQLPTKKQRY
jgi:hypothetical protein